MDWNHKNADERESWRMSSSAVVLMFNFFNQLNNYDKSNQFFTV